MSFLGHLKKVSGWTLLSRILGLVRDVFFFGALGASPIASGFLLAFTVPNLFRRLLGEGALSAAIIPLLSQKKARDEAEFQKFSHGFIRWLSRLLGVLSLLGVLFFTLAALWPWPHLAWSGFTVFGAFLIPYLWAVCLAAGMAAILQVQSRFGVPAFSPIVLNLGMILPLITGILLHWDAAQIALALSICILLAGFVQVLLHLPGLPQKPAVFTPPYQAGKELLPLLLPGLAGGGIAQISLLLNRFVANAFDPGAVALLFLGSRLAELPIGLFVVAIGTIIFPTLSRLATRDNKQAFADTYYHGSHLILVLTLPSAIGLFILSGETIRALFQWGAFSPDNAREAANVLRYFAIALPFYGWVYLATRGLYAVNQIPKTVRVAGITLLCSLLLAIAGGYFAGVSGLAAASSLTILIQALLLQSFLQPHLGIPPGKPIWQSLARTAIAATIMAATVLPAKYLLASLLDNSSRPLVITGLLLCIIIGILVYGACLLLLGFRPKQEFAIKELP